MKENLEALIAAIGCLPIVAIGLFITGALVGEFVAIDAPAPPQWLLIPVVLLPLFTTLYLRAYRKQSEAGHWPDSWRNVWRKKPVGRREKIGVKSVEELWLEDYVGRGSRRPLAKILDNAPLWGWGAVVSFVALAYLFIWFGLRVAAQ